MRPIFLFILLLYVTSCGFDEGVQRNYIISQSKPELAENHSENEK